MASMIALLPMKAHSERVPGKNFREIAGKPLVRWILDTLLSIDEISKVVINTDAIEELAAVGIETTERVVLRKRSEQLCGDLVSMNKVLLDDIENTDATTYLMTHTTNPLLSAQTIRSAMQSFEGSKNDSLFTVNKVQTRFYRSDGSPVNHDPQNLIRTQDLEPWFEENSCLYLFGKDSFLKTRARIGETPLLFETPKLESIDIDTPTDWQHAEALLHDRQSTAALPR